MTKYIKIFTLQAVVIQGFFLMLTKNSFFLMGLTAFCSLSFSTYGPKKTLLQEEPSPLYTNCVLDKSKNIFIGNKNLYVFALEASNHEEQSFKENIKKLVSKFITIDISLTHFFKQKDMNLYGIFQDYIANNEDVLNINFETHEISVCTFNKIEELCSDNILDFLYDNKNNELFLRNFFDFYIKLREILREVSLLLFDNFIFDNPIFCLLQGPFQCSNVLLKSINYIVYEKIPTAGELNSALFIEKCKNAALSDDENGAEEYGEEESHEL